MTWNRMFSNVFDDRRPDYQERYRSEQETRLTPSTDVLKVYRQLKPWKLCMTLTHKEIKTLRTALESHYPHIEQQTKDYTRAVRWGFVKGVALFAVLILVILVIGGMML
jgi:hypothetical protein